MANSDRTMVRRTVGVPIINESARPDGKSIPTVRIANFKNWTRYRFAFGGQHPQLPVAGVHNGEQRYQPLLHRHLYRQSSPNFPMIYLQRTNLGFSLGYGNMTRPVV